MSKIILSNIHLLQTLADKRLSYAVREELVKNLPENAVTALRETLFNVVIGNLKGFPQKTTEKLTENRDLVFNIVDANDSLSEAERESLLTSHKALELLSKILPAILEVLLSEEHDQVDHHEHH
jgi:hypothetical protein